MSTCYYSEEKLDKDRVMGWGVYVGTSAMAIREGVSEQSLDVVRE